MKYKISEIWFIDFIDDELVIFNWFKDVIR